MGTLANGSQTCSKISGDLGKPPLIGLTTWTSTVMSTAMTKNDAVTLEALPHEFEPSRSNTD